MSGWQWALLIAGGWLLLAAVVGLLVGRVLRHRDREPRPPHVEPSPRPRKHPQRWPLRRGHEK